MAILIGLFALIALWLFIRHDQSRIKNSKLEPLSRESMKGGYAPGKSVVWKGQLGGALMSLIWAVTAFINPTLPPFTGRWSLLNSALYSTLGTYGIAAFSGILSVVFAALAYSTYKSSPSK